MRDTLLKKMRATLEWYADSKNYHPNGSPGAIIEEMGLEMWELDRGKLAAECLELLDLGPGNVSCVHASVDRDGDCLSCGCDREDT